MRATLRHSTSHLFSPKTTLQGLEKGGVPRCGPAARLRRAARRCDRRFSKGGRRFARLSLQVKRSLTISKARSNSDFRDIIRNPGPRWLSRNFARVSIDTGPPSSTVTAAKVRALTTLCELARESPTTEHFDARFAPDGNAGPPVRAVKDDVAALLDEINGSPCRSAQLHRFLAHFVLIKFDFLHEGATDPPAAITRIRDCLSIRRRSQGAAHLVEIGPACALIRRISPAYSIAPAWFG